MTDMSQKIMEEISYIGLEHICDKLSADDEQAFKQIPYEEAKAMEEAGTVLLECIISGICYTLVELPEHCTLIMVEVGGEEFRTSYCNITDITL